jgi:hypothetical protein
MLKFSEIVEIAWCRYTQMNSIFRNLARRCPEFEPSEAAQLD